MLTGNEPVSAGNLKAALGGMGRVLSITSGSAAGSQKGDVTMTGAATISNLGGGSDFAASQNALACSVEGDYSITATACLGLLGNSDGNARADATMRITRGSVVAEIPIASIFASKAEGSTPNKTKTASVGYRAHLKIGDKIEFVYFYKTSSGSGSYYSEVELRAGYCIERTK
ncbi:hypothetical protein DMP07_04255 [Slackia faecicanis]|uniref:Uncharacterized protein n=1 Tax=Slackia faecicanis TaxID=255723 RepID=A0A3N0AG50_9ACTN|nr:hypothetical protein [Slackia faecicanis]RNL20796.1 hypothetical protein DMP07_04255 [Slackia faecicanis]